MHQCFLICPFGSGSHSDDEKALRVQLEGLYRYVFEPTISICKTRGYDIKIDDSRRIAHGKREVKRAVQKCIDDAAAVIVILNADNPNVYLELGWAQGMWQAPILLKKAGYIPPADISSDLFTPFEVGFVDGTDQAGAEQLATELADKIIEKIKRGREIPFEHWPSTTLARGTVSVYSRFLNIKPKQWSRLIDSAKKEIILGSSSMWKIRGQEFYTFQQNEAGDKISLEHLLLKKAQDGVNVVILMYHQDNYQGGHLKKNAADELDAVHDNLKKSFEKWSTLRLSFETTARRSETEVGSFRVIQVKRHHLPFRVTLTEQRVLATLRLYTEGYNSGLAIDAVNNVEDGPNTVEGYDTVSFYKQIREELEFIITQNSEASEDAYSRWTEERRRRA